MQTVAKIGIYGGSFDPPHNAHIELAIWVVKKLSLHRIYFVPAARHALKDNAHLTPVDIRYEMLQAAIGQKKRLQVSRIEMDRKETSYTVDTLNTFQAYEGLEAHELYYILGIDNLAEFHLWKRYEEIFKLAKVVVLNRPGFADIKIPPQMDRLILLNSPLFHISASEIREKIKAGKSVKGLISPEVNELILKYDLYRK